MGKSCGIWPIHAASESGMDPTRYGRMMQAVHMTAGGVKPVDHKIWEGGSEGGREADASSVSYITHTHLTLCTV